MRHLRPRRFVPGMLVVLALTGCAETPAPVVDAPRPVLPAAPAEFGRPVALPRPHVGEDARGYAARALVAGAAANRRLGNDAAFWRDVELRFGPPDK